jgi:cytochrome P450
MIELFLPEGLPQWLPWPWVRAKRNAISRLKEFVQGLPVQCELPFDEVLNLMLAGHETTASAMSWMLYLLAQRPEDCERCASDLDYCEKVARETLRLYPPAPAVFLRQALRDLSIDGYFLPKGSVVHLSSWAIQRDPLLWERSAEFWPERPPPSHPQSYFPFGYGPRSCLGQGLALLEMSHLAHWLCQHFHLSSPTQVARTEMRFSLWPGWPLQLSLRSR